MMQSKESKRLLVNVPSVSGDYAEERITFGVCSYNEGSGTADVSYLGVTALIEGGWPAGATVELWLPSVADANVSAAGRANGNYFYAGLVLAQAGTAYAPTGATASFGSATWPLAGYPGAQLRVKSGGIAGSVYLSATAD